MLRIAALSCLFLAVLAAKQVPSEKSKGVIQKFNDGQREAGDDLIWTGSGQKGAGSARQIVIQIPFPMLGFSNDAVITEIVATTNQDAGSSQFAIQNGGVGEKSFNLKIVSNNARKVNYKYQVYGKYS